MNLAQKNDNKDLLSKIKKNFAEPDPTKRQTEKDSVALNLNLEAVV